jgi:hypothetical protein
LLSPILLFLFVLKAHKPIQSVGFFARDIHSLLATPQEPAFGTIVSSLAVSRPGWRRRRCPPSEPQDNALDFVGSFCLSKADSKKTGDNALRVDDEYRTDGLRVGQSRRCIP